MPGVTENMAGLPPGSQPVMPLAMARPGETVELVEVRSGLGLQRRLAEMGQRIRSLKGFGLDEGVSSRLLVYVGRLVKGGLSPIQATRHAISQTLTDEPDVLESIQSIARLYFGDLMEEDADGPRHPQT